ncbi:MAG: hypothetical protein PHW69_03060 [Elusimicrobiaceae bacterium]|nr:hypothetical protein [Elusimicrobiaceae bacterium]
MTKYITGLLVLTIGAFFVFEENYKYTEVIEPAALLEPYWSEAGAGAAQLFMARTDKFNMTVAPLSGYTVSGLVMKVKKNNSPFSSLSKIRAVQPATVSLAFADNLRTGAYKTAKHSLGSLNWPQQPGFNAAQFKEITLVTADKDAKMKINSLKPGDQITLAGLCVTKVDIFVKDEQSGQPQFTLTGEPDGSLLYLADPAALKILRRGSTTAYRLFLTFGLLTAVMILLKFKY